MYVQFCNEPQRCAYLLVNETLWYETETFGNYVSRLSRDRDVETETTSLIMAPSYMSTVNLIYCDHVR